VKRRYLYLLLFSVPIVLASAVVAFAVFGAAAGIVWLFLAGDTPWPPAADILLGAVFVLAFAASALAFTSWAYAVGRQAEASAALNGTHVWAAVGTTVLLLDDAEGNTWVMKGFQQGLKPRYTYKEFVAAGAGNFKKLPPGWKFRVKTLDKDLIEKPENGVATIMPDEFFNVYDKSGPGMSNYKP